jgi:endonuclease/exonuclease/phosphatase (EEP) superfamily protein YafD
VLRLLGILGTVMFAIAVAVLTWPSFFRLERTFPIAQIVSFRGLLAIAFAALAIVALLFAIARPMRALALTVALIAVVSVVANVAVVAARGVGTDTLPAKTEDSIRVMTWNTAGSATAPDTVAQIAVAMDADIVTLPETTIETGEKVALAMRDLGHPMWAHYTDYPSTQWDAGSTTLLI